MKKTVKGILIGVSSLLGVTLLLVGGYVGYVFGQYYRLEDNLDIEVENKSLVSSNINLNEEYKISTYNIGFGAYNQEYTFFMDEGYMEDGTKVVGTEASAFSKEAVLEDTNGAANTIKNFNPDFAFFQEVDTDSKRSYHVNQYDIIKETMGNYTSTYACNFHSAYLMYPLNKPMGVINSGIATLSKFNIESSVRKSFTITDNKFDRLFDLDRCFNASYLPINGSDKKFVLVNIHMSAYDKGGTIREKQMQELNAFLDSEVEKGNYIVAGGDFNHDLLTYNPDYSFTKNNKPFSENFTQLTPDWLSFFFDENGNGPINSLSVVASSNTPTCRDADITWQPGVSYVSTIDGFLVSSNIEVISHANIQTATDNLAGFAYSDHDPATMTFKLKI